MKTYRILLALTPLMLLAASTHEGFGNLRFGMNREAASKAVSQLTTQAFAQKHRALDASDARNHFVTSGTKRSSAMAGKDSAFPISVAFNAEPLVSEVWIESRGTPSADGAKEAWSVFQDIGDAKFARVGKKGEFPAVDAFGANNNQAVTDTWEEEGIRVGLIVLAVKSPDATGNVYFVRLKATDKPAN